MSDYDTDFTDYPVCPHCGYEHRDWECHGDGEQDDCECESCGESMDVSTSLSISYTTTKSPPRCKRCRGEKEHPSWVGFKPEGGALKCDDPFHAEVKR